MDDENSSLGISILKCQLKPERIKCLKIKQHEKLFIAVWKMYNLSIYNNENVDITDKSIFKSHPFSEKDDLSFRFNIFDVFMTKYFIYVAEENGSLHELHYSVFHLDDSKNRDSSEAELFQFSQGCLHGWTKTDIGNLADCDSLMGITAINSKFIAITKTLQTLLGQVYSINQFQRLFVINLQEISVDKVILSCTEVQISNELKSQYFSFMDKDTKELALVGLGSGDVLSFSLAKHTPKPEIVFSSSEEIIGIEYNIDNNTCTAILILFVSGQLIILDGKRSQSVYIPGPLRIAIFNNDTSLYFTSDAVDSILTKIQFDDTVQELCTKPKIKGVRAVCNVPGIPDIILAATAHQDVYWLDTSSIKFVESSEFVMPEEEVVKELLLAMKNLKDANIKTEKDNSILTAISMTSRAKFLQKYFTILVKFYSGRQSSDDKLKLRIECDCDFVSFTPDLWTLNTVISFGENCVVSFENKLDKIFTKYCPLTVEINCSPIIESELTCKMIARINCNGKEHLLIVSLGKITIDAGYFFTIAKDKKKLLQRIDESSRKKEALYEYNISHTGVNNSHLLNDTKIVAYSVTVSDKLPIDKIIPMILRNSSHRMSKNQWSSISDHSVGNVLLAINNQFWVELNLDKSSRILHIKSNDPYVCYSVKRAISSRLGRADPVVLDPSTYIEAEGIKYRYELARLTEEWDLKSFQDMKHNFRARFS